jgi:hypothetical protein
MRRVAILALVAAQLGTAASAADLAGLASPQASRAGGFAGARLRVALDGQARERVRVGLAVAPAVRIGSDRGPGRLRIGEGLELGFGERSAPRLALGGKPVRELVRSKGAPEGRRANLSTLGWVAVGAAVVAVGYFAWFAHEMNKCEPHDDEC